jgi:hypothetical protein
LFAKPDEERKDEEDRTDRAVSRGELRFKWLGKTSEGAKSLLLTTALTRQIGNDLISLPPERCLPTKKQYR